MTGPSARTPRRRPATTKRPRLRAALAAVGALLLAAALPAVLWHPLVTDVAARFRWDLRYFVSEWSPWFLLAAGLAFLTPVAISAGAPAEGRFPPPVRRAYFGWGVVLYLLGLLLAIQVAQLYGLTN